MSGERGEPGGDNHGADDEISIDVDDAMGPEATRNMDAFQQAWRMNKARQEELRRQDLDPEAKHLLLRQRVQGIQDAQSTLQQYREDDTHPGSERTYAEMRDYQMLHPPAPDHRPMTPGFQPSRTETVPTMSRQLDLIEQTLSPVASPIATCTRGH